MRSAAAPSLPLILSLLVLAVNAVRYPFYQRTKFQEGKTQIAQMAEFESQRGFETHSLPSYIEPGFYKIIAATVNSQESIVLHTMARDPNSQKVGFFPASEVGTVIWEVLPGDGKLTNAFALREITSKQFLGITERWKPKYPTVEDMLVKPSLVSEVPQLLQAFDVLVERGVTELHLKAAGDINIWWEVPSIRSRSNTAVLTSEKPTTKLYFERVNKIL